MIRRIEAFLHHVFDSNRKRFEKGGKLQMLFPFFEALEAFFFIPAMETEKPPYVRDHLDLKRYMSTVILALVPPLLFGIYNTGYQSLKLSGAQVLFSDAVISGMAIVLPIILVSYAVGFFWETLFAHVRGHSISEGFLVTGLLFPLTLPPTTPLWQVAVGISFGVVVGKEIFGGTGRNIFNPALTGRAFLFFAYPAQMSGDQVWVAGQTLDAVTGPTPLAVLTIVEPHTTIYESLKAAGYDIWTVFAGFIPGSIGETSALCCLIGAVILILTGIASYRIMAGGVIGVVATGFLFNLFAGPESLPWLAVSPFYHLVAGGFAFGIVYMATDPVSAPGLDLPRWIFGILIGVLTVLIRVVNPAFPEGVMLSILFMNLFAPLLDYFRIRVHVNNRIPNV